MYFVHITCKCFMKHKQNMDNPYITFNRLITNSFSFIKETFTWTIFHIFLYSMVKRDPIHRNWLVVYTHYRSYNAYVNKPQILRAAISCHQGETRFYPIVWYWKKNGASARYNLQESSMTSKDLDQSVQPWSALSLRPLVYFYRLAR